MCFNFIRSAPRFFNHYVEGELFGFKVCQLMKCFLEGIRKKFRQDREETIITLRKLKQ